MTLLENLTVAAMVGVLATVAVPSWTGFVAAQQIKTDANAVHDVMNEARSEATTKKLQLQYALWNCQTEDSCWQLLEDNMQQAACESLAVSLIGQPSLQLQYWEQKSYVLWEDGTCSLATTLLETRKPLVPSASAEPIQTDTNVLFNLPSLVQLDKKQDKTVTGKDEPTSKGESRRDKAAAKKPKKSTLNYTGCFRSNGQFLMQKDSQWFNVDFSSLPKGAVIKAEGKSCTELGVQ